MGKTNKIHIILEWLIAICIVSTGYSGWAIVVNDEANANFSMLSYPVMNTDDYVEIVEEHVVMFEFCDYGFLSPGVSSSGVGEDGLSISNVGTISIPLTFNKACFNDADKQITLEMELAFVNSSTKAVNTFFVNGCNITAKVDGVSGNYFDTTITNPNYWAPSISSGTLTFNKVVKFTGTVPTEDSTSFNLVLTFEVKEDGTNTLETMMSSLNNQTLSIKTVVKGYQ